MKIAAIALSLVASAAAFAPASNTQQRSGVALQETKADLEALAKDLNPVSSTTIEHAAVTDAGLLAHMQMTSTRLFQHS